MSEEMQNPGVCSYCGADFSRGGMARHLTKCKKRAEALTKSGQGETGRVFYHLRARDAWDKAYWLHLEVDGSATLADLDDYLRVIWLECCGHLSEFAVGASWEGRVPMSRKIRQAFAEGVEVTHTYDFGTESVTRIKALATRQGKAISKHSITLMARNRPPVFACQECQRIASHLCHECQVEEDRPGFLCQEHAESHPHEDYGPPIPIVNSPRLGLCGYTGPAEAPW